VNIDLFVLQYLERRYASKIMRVVGCMLSVTNAVGTRLHIDTSIVVATVEATEAAA